MTPTHRADAARPSLGTRSAARVGAVLLLLGGVVALRSIAPGTTIELPAAASPPTSAAAEMPAAPPTEAEAGPVVHVTGAVAEPGLYTLLPGARVADAIAAAGGMAEDADESALNLAAPVADGSQIYVVRTGESPPAGATVDTPAAGSGLVNLNTADAAALETLPGIGPALAERIIAYRESNGPFASVADLDAVSGIGPAILGQIEGEATV